MTALLEKVRRRLGDETADDALLLDILEDAGAMIRAFTGRTAVPDALRGAVAELAVEMYNRMGMEGESAHAEGSVSRTADFFGPALRAQLLPYRLAKTLSGEVGA